MKTNQPSQHGQKVSHFRLTGRHCVAAWVVCGGWLWAAAQLLAQPTAGGAGPGRRDSYEISLHSRTFTPVAGWPESVKEGLRAHGRLNLSQARRTMHAFVQLDQVPTPSDRESLKAQGITLLTYVPNKAWLAAIPADNPEAALSRPGLRWGGVLQAADKTSPALRRGELGTWAYDPAKQEVIVLVQLFKDVGLADGRTLVRSHGGQVLGDASLVNTLVVRLPRAAVELLAAEDIVEWIEQPIPLLTSMNAENRAIVGANTLQAVPYGLNGSGVDVMIYDAGRAYPHNDLVGHMDFGDSAPFIEHSTHVAGTVAGNGTVNYNLRGMAPAAYLLSMGFWNDGTGVLLYTQPGGIQNALNYAKNGWARSADLLNMSIGANVAPLGLPCALEGNYGVTDQLLDSICHGSLGEPFIMACSAGNERGYSCGSGYHTATPPGGAKNPIHSGATDDYDAMSSFSAWGPTDDGRLKPTICAPGVNVLSCDDSTTGYVSKNGTSMASPTTAGIIALMLQQYRITYGTTGEFLPASAKALLIHTALDRGNPGPDYQFGYGRIRAVEAVNEIINHNFREQSISLPGEVHQYAISVPAGTPELRISLAWDDPAGSLAALKQLVNDLDLVAIAPDGATNYPWVLNPANPGAAATRGVDELNNQEQVVVPSPAAGTWLVRVTASVLPESPQWYSIVFPGAFATTPSITPGSATTPALGLSYEAVTNGTFETGTTPWTLSGSATRTNSYAHGGASSLALGGTIDGGFYQQIAVPPNAAEAVVSYWVRMTTSEVADGSPHDFLFVELRDSLGNTVATPNLIADEDTLCRDQWAQYSFTLGPEYAGTSIRLYFGADVNSSTPTWFYVDDVTCYTIPTCFTYPASSLTQTSAVLSASINARGQNTWYYLQYGTTTHYGSATSATSLGAGTSYLSVSNSISGLIPATLYNCRVVATNASQAVCGANVTFVTAAFPPLNLTLNPGAVTEGAGVLTNAGTVTLTSAPTTPLTVQLTCSNTNEITVPAQVVIAAGQLATNFNVVIKDDGKLDGSQTVTVIASAPNCVSSTASIIVHDSEKATLSVTAPSRASDEQGSVTGRVNVSAAPAVAVEVSLTSSDTNRATLPAKVTIAAAQLSSTNFNVTIANDHVIDGTHPVTLTAHVQNWTDGVAHLAIVDNTNLTVVLPAQALEGQGTVAGTVSVAATLSSNLVITVASSDPTEVVGTNITLQAGQLSTNFNLAVVDDSGTDGAQAVTVTVSAAGFYSANALLTVKDNDVHHFSWSAIPTPQIAGAPFPVTLTAQDINSQPITNWMGSVALSGAGDCGAILMSPAATGPFTNGQWPGTLTVYTACANVRLAANDGATHTGQSAAFTVQPAPLARFDWSSIAETQFAGMPVAVTLTARDTNNNRLTAFTNAVSLSGWAGPSEVTIGSGTFSWSFPFRTYFEDARVQVIYPTNEIGAARALTSLALDVTTLPGQTLNHWTIRMKHTSLNGYTSPAAWEGTGWTTVYQTNQSVTSTGWVTFAFATPFAYNGTNNLMVDFSYNNASDSADGYCRYTSASPNRTLYYMSDSGYGDPLAWSGTNSPAPNVSGSVPNIKLPALQSSVALSPTNTGPLSSGAWTGAVRVLQVARNMVLRADAGSAHSSDSNPFNAESSGLHHFGWSAIASPQTLGVSFPVTLSALDTNGITVTSYTNSVALSGWVGSAALQPTNVIQNPSYEATAGWSAYATKPADIAAFQSGNWSSDGPYSFGSSFWFTSHQPGDYAAFSQLVDWTGVGALKFDCCAWFADKVRARLLIGGTEVWSLQPSGANSETWSNVMVDVAGISGSRTLELRAEVVSNGTYSCSFFWDNLRACRYVGKRIPIAPATVRFSGGAWTGAMTSLGVATNLFLHAEDGGGTIGESNPFNVQAAPLLISGVWWEQANRLVFHGTGGPAGRTYYVLASTNAAAALANWLPVATNTFEPGGGFSVTNTVDRNKRAQFFRLWVP